MKKKEQDKRDIHLTKIIRIKKEESRKRKELNKNRS